MCTRDRGARIRETFLRCRGGRMVEKGDIEILDVLADASRIEFYFDHGVVYARSVEYRGRSFQ